MAVLAKLPLSKRALKIVTERVDMTVDEWIAVPDNPRQRDTERHLRRAKHLLSPSPTHAIVSMATDGSGRRWKLDGHTRALAWRQGLVERPAKVIATVYPVVDAAEAAELYRHFDNQAAVETGADQIAGAWREYGWAPEAPLLRTGGLINALRFAQGLVRNVRTRAFDMTPYDLVRAWGADLKWLDTLDPKWQQFVSSTITAALLCHRRDGEDATDFWRLYAVDGGQKYEGLLDPVEALSKYIREARAARKLVSAAMLDIVGKALAAYVAHGENRTYTGGLKGVDPVKFMPPERYSA